MPRHPRSTTAKALRTGGGTILKLPLLSQLSLICLVTLSLCARADESSEPGPEPRRFADLDSEIAFARSNTSAWFEGLLHTVRRPSLTRVVKVLDQCTECVLFVNDIHRTSILDRQVPGAPNQTMGGYLREHGPEMIAFFTAFFPYGTYATLGRDAYFVGDVLEAFYISLGLPSPVTRLRASSFTVKIMTEDLMAELLTSNGLDLAKVLSSEQSFVIIDRTPFRTDSQSARFYRSILNASKSARERREIGLNVSVVSSQAGWPGWRDSTSAHLSSEFATVKLKASQWPIFSSAMPVALLGPESLNKFMDQDALAWHSPFEAFLVQDPDGSWGGRPGAADNMQLRRLTLRSFWEIYKLVRSFPFREDVWKVGQKYGLDLRQHFTANLSAREANAKRLAQLKNEIRAELWEIADAMPEHWILSYAHRQLLNLVQSRLERFLSAPDGQSYELDRMRRQMLRAETNFTDPISKLFAEVSYDLPPHQFLENKSLLESVFNRWTHGLPFTALHFDDMNRQLDQNERLGLIDNEAHVELKNLLREVETAAPHPAHYCGTALRP